MDRTETSVVFGEKITWYAVASVWSLKSEPTKLVCGSHLFSVKGDDPLTSDEAKNRAVEYHKKNWPEDRCGGIDKYELTIQSIDVHIIHLSTE